MVCRLGDERNIIFEEKEKNPYRGQKWIGGDKMGSSYIQLCEIFLWYLLNATSFTPNVWRSFRALKPMSRDLLGRNLVQADILLF